MRRTPGGQVTTVDGLTGGLTGGPADGPAEGLCEPLPETTAEVLRRAVHRHVADVRVRRAFPAVLHVGVPGGRTGSMSVPAERTDPGLRTDLVAALRVRAGVAAPAEVVWLARRAGLELQDVDVEWLAAARAAFAEAGAPLVFVVVTRRGWRDPRSGVGRSWGRVRGGGPPPATPL